MSKKSLDRKIRDADSATVFKILAMSVSFMYLASMAQRTFKPKEGQ
jgi:hypothetical protein